MSGKIQTLLGVVLGLLVLGSTAENAYAAEYFLCAGAGTVTMPDGVVVPVWGFALDDNANLADGCGTGVVQVPGPRLTVPSGDSALTVNVLNELPSLAGQPTPVSIVIPGQVTAMSPVLVGGRVRSFTQETLPGTVGTYSWANFAPGTYAYHSGTHPQVQVQMGLYGAATRDSGAGEAYAGVGYDHEVVLVYSELDPALHAAVASDDYGPGLGTTSTIDYAPQYYLVNGQPFTAASSALDAGAAGQRTLLRMINMGLKEHSIVLQGVDMKLVAEGGSAYPYGRAQYSALLAPSGTKDAVVTPGAPGTAILYDRRLNLTTAGQPGGGMMTRLFFGVPVATDTVSIVRTRYLNSAANPQTLRVWAVSDQQPGATLTLQGYGAMNYQAGNQRYFLEVTGVAANPGLVTVTSDQGGSDTQAVPFTGAPVASDDAHTTPEDAVLTVAAPGLLANDSLGGTFNVALSAQLDVSPGVGSVVVNADGSFTYTPLANFAGIDAFSYVVTDGTGTSAPATVVITVSAVNDAPIAVDDGPYSVLAGQVLSIPAAQGVLVNDSDPEGDLLSAVLLTQPLDGFVSLSPNGAFDYVAGLLPGQVTFTYVAFDGNAASAPTTVTIDVLAQANTAPVAVDDYAQVRRNTLNNPTGFSVTMNLVANDSDAEGNLDPTTLTIVTPPIRGGTLVNNGDGTITYTPAPQYRGTEVFTYAVSDTDGAVSNTATVRIDVVRPRDYTGP